MLASSNKVYVYEYLSRNLGRYRNFVGRALKRKSLFKETTLTIVLNKGGLANLSDEQIVTFHLVLSTAKWKLVPILVPNKLNASTSVLTSQVLHTLHLSPPFPFLSYTLFSFPILVTPHYFDVCSFSLSLPFCFSTLLLSLLLSTSPTAPPPHPPLCHTCTEQHF